MQCITSSNVLLLVLMIAALIVASGAAGPSHAQSPTITPASLPTTGPATGPLPHRVVIPPGFKVLQIANHTALLEPADEPWVRQVLQNITPTTMPTTMPGDLLERLAAQRDALKTRLAADLALSDPAVVDRFLDENLLPLLRKFDEVNPPIYYMVTTRQRLVELLKGGWSDPRFYYNRAADDVQMRSAVNLNTDGPSDDVLIPVIYAPSDPPQTRSELLTRAIHGIELELAARLGLRAHQMTQQAFVAFVAEHLLPGVKLASDQQWFMIGTAFVLSARYIGQVSGMEEARVVAAMTADNPQNPMRPATIDLLHPTPPEQMRPQALGAYADAYNRKASRAIANWLSRAGPQALPKALLAIRQNPPADGAALISLIQQSSGVDLSSEVSAGR
ncbi:MAG TPA: hypothetical protein VNL70_04925 [Tepidisphaeraceae bacterium]|nr:hypothetical protein [Tepidisphaeraceae bacterium]